MALRYYLTIDGIAGDSISDGHRGAFDVAGYSFDVGALVNALSGGGGGAGGRPTFSPLTVDLDLNAGLTSLLNNVATGRHIRSIELEGVSADGQTVYDLTLGNVVITRVHDSNTGHDTLSFSYQQVSLTTTPQHADGRLGTPETFSFDIAANSQGVNIPDPAVPAGGPTGGGGAESYYLTIDGIAGDSVSDGHRGAFDVAGYSFDVSALVNALSSGGAGGRPSFSPLTVDLDLNSGLTSLLNNVATGRHIRSIELEGVSADGQTVYELKLGDVVVTSFHDSNTGHDMLSFSYQQVSLTTTPQHADGRVGTPSTFSFDIAMNSQGVSIPDPRVPAGGPTGGGAETYYLTIDGIAGDSTSDGHRGAFDVAGYSFDVSAIVNALGGGGAGGRPTFSPLTVDLDLNSGLTSLLNNVATGRHIRSLELEGVSADGQTVYELKLGDVVVTSFHDSNTGHDMLSFSYQQVSLTTTPQHADGRVGTPSTFSFDIATNSQGVSIPDPRVPAGGPTGGGAETYYLTIDGVAGDSISDGHRGAFDVADYSFDVSALVNALSGGGGGAGGRPTFSPLTVDLDLNSGLTSLLSNVATGRHIRSIELEGVSADGKTVYELKLGDVVVTSFHDSNTGHDMLSFSYQQVSLTTTPQHADGRIGTPSTFSFDVAANSPNASIPDPRVPPGGPTGGGAESYYLTIDGVAGDSTSDDHRGAFDVSGYSFDVNALVSAMSGGGAGGRPTFSPLTVDLDLNSGLTSLLNNVATGRHIRSLELEGVSADGRTVYELKLGDVVVTSFRDSNTGHDMLSFSYQQVSLTTTPQHADGRVGTPSTFSFDIATNSQGVSIPDPRVPAGGPTGGGAETYYLTIDGIAGDSISDDHRGAFDVAGYSFDVSAIVNAMSGGGAGGRPTFSPLTVDLDLNSGLTSLLNNVATGRHIRSLELEGVSADGRTVYELKLGDVVVTSFRDSNTGHDMLSFSYQQVSLTTTPQHADGRVGTPSTFSFDVAANRQGVTIPDPRVPAGDPAEGDGENVNIPDPAATAAGPEGGDIQGVTIPDPAVPAGGPTGGDAESYYLTIDGVAGDSTSDGHRGAFDVAGYSFDVSALVNALSSGGAGGRPSFSPLTVDLDLNSGLTSLLNNVATGRHIRSIELEGVSADGQTVYELKLGDVVVTSFHDSNTGHDMLSFSYQQVSLTTTPQHADGRVGTPETFSFDVAANSPNASIPDPRVPAGGPTGGGGAESYYLTIDGVAGDSTSDGHRGAFDVAGYSFDVSALVNALSGGGGGATGRPTFSPLTIELDLNSGLTSLLNNVATGRHIRSIELEGVSPDGTTVYDLKLGDVVLTTYHDSNTGHDMLSFSYQQVNLTTTPQHADGRVGTPSTFSFDVGTNSQGVTVPDPHVPAGGPTGGGHAESYYLTIDGVAGDSTSDAHRGAFDVTGYNFDVSALVSAMSGGGAGGRPMFSPLTVDLDLNSGLTSLLNNAATGRHIRSLELEGVSADGQTIYDLKLGDVVVTTLHDSNTGHDVLSFSYQQVSLTTTPQHADGRLGTPETFSFNIAANSPNASIPDPGVPAGGPTGGDAESYYLTIDGVAGDSTSDDHRGAFEVAGYSFDVSAIVNALSSGGAGGRSTFSPLTVDLDLNSGLTSLLSNVATGRHIRSIELEGVSADGQTVYDLKLGDVVITSFHDSNTGHDMLSFSYQQVSLTTTPQHADGRIGTPSTFSFDVAANSPNASIPDPRVPPGGPTGGGAESYYLTIDGVAGDSTSDDHRGAFDVSGYSFDVNALVSAMSGGGAGGRPTFSPLTVDLDLNSGLTSLLNNVATGRHIRSLELEGVSADGRTVYELKLGDVVVTSFRDSNTGHDMLSFSYQQVSLTTTPQHADGRIGTPSTFSFDVATNSPNASIPDPRVPAGGPTGGDAESYYLTIDGVAGDSTSDGHRGAFDVAGYSFDVSAIVNAVSNGGAAGRPDFSPLTVELDLNSGLTALLNNVATGRHIRSIELEGVSADGQTVYELKLGDVVVTSFHDSSTGNDMLSFSYEQVNLTTTPQHADGRVGTPSTFSFDIAANRQDVSIPDPSVPTDGHQHPLNGNEADVLVGGPGHVLTGNHPGRDAFIFTGDFGSNEITNFSRSDHILLEKSTFGTASDVLEHYAADDGHGNTIITDPHNPENKIIVDHVSVAELDVADFVLL